jgi:hypothetical protein
MAIGESCAKEWKRDRSDVVYQYYIQRDACEGLGEGKIVDKRQCAHRCSRCALTYYEADLGDI